MKFMRLIRFAPALVMAGALMLSSCENPLPESPELGQGAATEAFIAVNSQMMPVLQGGGEITAEVHYNQTEYCAYPGYADTTIESIQGADPSLGTVSYQWQIDKGLGWESAGGSSSSYGYADLFMQHMVKMRRLAVTSNGVAPSNECEIYNHAFYPAPKLGTVRDPYFIGSFDSDFTYDVLLDSRGPFFYDPIFYRWETGKPGDIQFDLETTMNIDLVLHSPTLGGIMVVFNYMQWDYEDGYQIYDGLSGGYNHGIPDFTYIDSDGAWLSFEELEPGHYTIYVMGKKGGNAGDVNGLMYTRIYGTAVE